MSHLVNSMLCANFEDYDKYDEVSCTLKHWPDMWPEEIAAEAGVWRERMEIRKQTFFLARDKTKRVLMHFRTLRLPPAVMKAITKKVLVQLADDCGWEVRNPGCVTRYDVSRIYRTS